jgi:hypothetical protein
MKSNLTKDSEMRKIVLSALLALAMASAQAGLFSGIMKTTVEQELATEVTTLNKQLPKMADKETRIDSVSSGPGRLFTYHYTMINDTAGTVNLPYFIANFAPGLRAGVCQNLAQMIKRGVTVAYEYRGHDGKPITTVTTTPASCGK